MHVEPKPSPWPCVIMLAGLLLFCLTVPRYWQSGDTTNDFKTPEPIDGSANAVTLPASDWVARSMLGAQIQPFGTSSFGDPDFGIPAGTTPENGLLSLCPPPTIEELLETARLGSLRFEAMAPGAAQHPFGWPIFASPFEISSNKPRTKNASQPTVMPSALITAALERIGRLMAEYSPADVLEPLLSGAARLHEWASRRSPVTGERPDVATPVATPEVRSPLASTLRLIAPDDRLAMRPAPAVAAPPQAEPIATPMPAARSADDEADEGTIADPWCVPQVLFEQLERLGRHPYSAEWAQSTIGQLHDVTHRDRLGSDDIATLLSDIYHSAQQAARMAEETSDDRLRVELLRAHWALARRLDCWAVLHEIRTAEHSDARVASRGSLHSLFHDVPADVRNDAKLPTVSVNLEVYEKSRDPQLGRQVVAAQRTLASSPDSLDRTLAEAVEQHYRNANVRVAITSAMLNRLIGVERSQFRPVRDRIAGTPVRGRSHTLSANSVRLEPATGRWQFGVEAQGVVQSNTLADGGGARLRSVGATDFRAQKTVIVDSAGVRLEPTAVDATNRNRLVGVTTDFDWVPLFGSYARSRAMQQYRAKRHRARMEVEYKVATEAVEQMDRETLEAVDRMEQEMRERFTDPMAKFGIDLTPIELTTTEERLVARLRVAGDHQLGGHTPRPRALSDSLASVQVHETALTNAAISLGLDGRRFTAIDLQAMLREKFPQLAAEDRPEARGDTVFEFAYRDAVRFRIEGGRLELMLSLANLEHQGRATPDFIVHAFYVPVVDGLSAELVRDGSLGIEGRLSSTQRARLHNVFNSVLSEERRLPIVRLEDPNDPRLEDLTITQLVLEDGWVGIAVGPGNARRVAERSRSLR